MPPQTARHRGPRGRPVVIALFTTHPRGGGLGRLPGSLWVFPGLSVVPLGLRQREVLGSVFLPGATSAGRGGEAGTLLGDIGGLLAPCFREGTSELLILRCGAARRRASGGCFRRCRRVALQSPVRRHCACAWIRAWLARRTALLSRLSGPGCVLEARVRKRIRARGGGGPRGQGVRPGGGGGPPSLSSPSLLFALDRKGDTNVTS